MYQQFNEQFAAATRQFAETAAQVNRLALDNAGAVFGLQLAAIEDRANATFAFLGEATQVRDAEGLKDLLPKAAQVARENIERGVATFAPALAEDAAEDAAVTFTFSRDYSVRAAIVGYSATEVAGGVLVGDRRLVILEDALDDAGVTDPPKANDRATFEGRQFTVVNAAAIYGDGVPVAWDVQVRG